MFKQIIHWSLAAIIKLLDSILPPAKPALVGVPEPTKSAAPPALDPSQTEQLFVAEVAARTTIAPFQPSGNVALLNAWSTPVATPKVKAVVEVPRIPAVTEVPEVPTPEIPEPEQPQTIPALAHQESPMVLPHPPSPPRGGTEPQRCGSRRVR